MIEKMVFKDTELCFCPNMNVILGENGTGKTSLLFAIHGEYPEHKPLFIPSSGVLHSNEIERVFTDSKSRMDFVIKSSGEQSLIFAGRLCENIDDFVQVKQLFWDNPENNINPKMMRDLVSTLYYISKKLQVFITTHSLFLIRELELIECRTGKRNSRYINLGDTIHQADNSDEIGDIAALDANIEQSEEYLAAEHNQDVDL